MFAQVYKFVIAFCLRLWFFILVSFLLLFFGDCVLLELVVFFLLASFRVASSSFDW